MKIIALLLVAGFYLPNILFAEGSAASSGDSLLSELKTPFDPDAYLADKSADKTNEFAGVVNPFTNEDDKIKGWRIKAKQGDANAQFSLGYAYVKGRGILQNNEEAVKWWRKAADQGHAGAQYNLGVAYEKGLGVPKDDDDAFKWWCKAAEQGDAQAQYKVGAYYAFSQEEPPDFNKAAKYFRLAAEQGHALAQETLGVFYINGSGVPPDDQEAIKWSRLAAEQGMILAQYNLGYTYAKNSYYREAVKWWRKAAEQGYNDAQHNLGWAYSTGKGILEDYVEAYAWYSLAAMSGDEKALHNKENLKNNMNSNQLARGQSRAKELLAQIEDRTRISDLKEDQVPAPSITPVGFGSGLLIQDGYILTCWHVVENAKRITINQQGKVLPAHIVCKDENNDLAILHAEQSGTGYSISFADRLRLGTQVFTMGFPHPDLQGTDVKYTAGTISSLSGPGNTPVYLQISVPVQAGNSGGPLFDEYGNLLGIVAAKLDSIAALLTTGDLPQNVNYAIKADYLLPMLKTIDNFNSRPPRTKSNNHQDLVAEIKKSIVMITVY